MTSAGNRTGQSFTRHSRTSKSSRVTVSGARSESTGGELNVPISSTSRDFLNCAISLTAATKAAFGALTRTAPATATSPLAFVSSPCFTTAPRSSCGTSPASNRRCRVITASTSGSIAGAALAPHPSIAAAIAPAQIDRTIDIGSVYALEQVDGVRHPVTAGDHRGECCGAIADPRIERVVDARAEHVGVDEFDRNRAGAEAE